MAERVTSSLGLTGNMALWRAYQRALTAHPWKVQVLTAGECTSETCVGPKQAILGGKSLPHHTSLTFCFCLAPLKAWLSLVPCCPIPF